MGLNQLDLSSIDEQAQINQSTFLEEWGLDVVHYQSIIQGFARMVDGKNSFNIKDSEVYEDIETKKPGLYITLEFINSQDEAQTRSATQTNTEYEKLFQLIQKNIGLIPKELQTKLDVYISAKNQGGITIKNSTVTLEPHDKIETDLDEDVFLGFGINGAIGWCCIDGSYVDEPGDAAEIKEERAKKRLAVRDIIAQIIEEHALKINE